MSDIIERAFQEGKPQHWSALSRWLRAHAGEVNHIRHTIQDSDRALADGVLFPVTWEEARLILRKYEHQRQTHMI